ncbi:MAG: helix-turn-helix domain-containing protein [Bacteroidota bacterium]
MKNVSFKLKPKDREFLINLTKTGHRNSREFERAYVLLAIDKGKKNDEITDFYDVSRITIWRVKMKYLEYGVEEAIKDEPRPGQPLKYDEKDNAEVIAMACTKAPDGRARWTLRLLEKTLKEDKGININRETIRLLLKKTNVSLG